VAYSGSFTNTQGITYTLKKYSTNNGYPYAVFGSSAGEDYTASFSGNAAQTNSLINTYAGSVEDFNAWVTGQNGNFLEVDGSRTYFQKDPNLVNAQPNTNATPRDANQSPTSTPIQSNLGGTGVGSSPFSSMLDQINAALGGLQSNSPQNAALNAHAQALGNASYNLMTQLQGQIQGLLGQSENSSRNALNTLTSQMNALGIGKQSLLDTTIARMNQLTTPSKRKKIDTEATKVAPQTSLFGL
jgi:hypothetical protein